MGAECVRRKRECDGKRTDYRLLRRGRRGQRGDRDGAEAGGVQLRVSEERGTAAMLAAGKLHLGKGRADAAGIGGRCIGRWRYLIL